MNEYKNKDERFYNKLKKLWSLFSKNCLNLKNERINRGKMFDFSLLSENEMVNIIIFKNEELKISYEIYQESLIVIQNRNFERFKFILEKYWYSVNSLVKKSLRTFKKYLEYIENSLNYDCNNGIIKEINRKIKTLKRTTCGYKSFYHFRARILICSNLLTAK